MVFSDREIPVNLDTFDLLYPSDAWGIDGNSIFPIKNPNALQAVNGFSENSELSIPEFQEDDFRDKYYFELAKQFPLDGEVVTWQNIDEPPIPRLYLSEVSGELQAQLRFGYGESEVLYDSNFPETSLMQIPKSWQLVRIHRQRDVEESVSKKLASATYALKRAPLASSTRNLSLTGPDPSSRLSAPPSSAPDPRRFRDFRRGATKVRTGKSANTDHFLFGFIRNRLVRCSSIVNFGELQVSLKDIRKALKKSERFIKLADGSIGEIPEEWLEKYRYLLGLPRPAIKVFAFHTISSP